MALFSLTLVVLFAASTAPTPLYHIYQEMWGFTPFMLTLVFAVYSLSLLLSLLMMGSLSDYIGRRAAISIGLLITCFSLGIFADAQSLFDLFLARILQGIGTGVMSSAVGAAMLDLDRKHGTLLNTLAPVIGMAVGILGTGEWVSYAPKARSWVFILLLSIFVVLSYFIYVFAEKKILRKGVLSSFRPRVHISSHIKRAYWLMAPINIAIWALGAFYLSLAPSVITIVTGSSSLSSHAIFLNMLSSAVTILCTRNCTLQTMWWSAKGALVFSMGTLIIGVNVQSTFCVLIASVLAGLAFGAGFTSALRSVLPLANLQERASVLSAIYIMNYISFSIPAIIAGIVAQHFNLIITTNIFCSILLGIGIITCIYFPNKNIST